MIVLGIETTGDAAGVAVADGGGVLAELVFRHRMQLSRLLVPRIAEVLALAELELAQVEGIGVSIGPGSFTGLRIGVTTAKALAMARGIPAAAVPTLTALAREHPAPPGALICAVAPASATQLFTALFQWRDGKLEARAEEMLMPSQDLAKKLAQAPMEVVLAGDPGTHGDLLRQALGPRLTTAGGSGSPRPGTIARLARERLLAGEVEPAHLLSPRYLRVSTAEARRQEAACPS